MPTKSTTAKPKTLSADATAAVQQVLEPVVVNLQALATDGKQAHWHVRGPNFQAIHELLDEVVSRLRDSADLAAERIVALGLPLDARAQTVGTQTTTPKLKPGFQQADAIIPQLVAGIDATLELVRDAADTLEELDGASQDVAIAIEQQLVKDRWFLSSHLSI